MSGLFKNVAAGSLLDDETEGESDYGLEALFSAADGSSSGNEEEQDDDVHDLDDFTLMWNCVGLIPDRDQVNRVMENRRKITEHIINLLVTLQQTINDTVTTGGLCSDRIHHIKMSLSKAMDLGNIMDQRLAFLVMRVELDPEMNNTLL